MEKRLSTLLACLILFVGEVFAQNVISGTVVSQEDDQPIIGASITVEGSRAGTVSDAQGRFSLSVPKGKKIIVSYLGMQSQTVTAKPGMRVVLANDDKTLGEVVVTGVQQMDKRTFTGATTKIDADKAKLDGIADISRSLEGRVAGVSVQNVSGTFGTAPKIRVRGATSIYGSSKPLWVVDGVIMEDVTSVDSQFNIMNSQEQMGIYKELYNDGWLSFSGMLNASSSGVYGKMYQLMNTYDPATGKFALANTDKAMKDYLREAEYRNTNWFDELFNSNVSRNHSISMSTGTDKAQYYVSFSYMSDPGWTLQSSVKRYTANVNANYNLSKKLSLNMIANASYRKQKAPGTTNQSVNAVTGAVSRDFDINPAQGGLSVADGCRCLTKELDMIAC